MAPKLRPRKKQKTEIQRTTGPAPPGSTGFADLPPELLLEIVNHLPLFPVPCNHLDSPMKESTNTRQEVLMVLVQLCCSFRRALVHHLWEEIILCSLHGGQRNTTTNPAWIRHSCGLDQGPYCASCERYLAFEIVSQLETVTTIVPEFARCLSLLPNLTTLQLFYNLSAHALVRDIQKAFSRYQYPNIRTLVIPVDTGSLKVLKACSNLRHLHFTSIKYFYTMDICPTVEKFTGESLPSLRPILFRSLPNLKYFQMSTMGSSYHPYPHSYAHYAEALSLLRLLEVVEIAIIQEEAKEEAKALRGSVASVLARMPVVSGIKRRVEVCDYTTRSS
ncbi:hypothetical protein BDN72DRAFT_955096 [Pluteus cervinus]|uniref:Uncharacterized protein n=1 Tax=Pluteus cervinus TaxID=181527 RepID=A0ACD3BBI9_9AGAR|nr:hypothetical protein BDN72DRAFT_955096 [Pluteus cervinus]